MFHYARLAPDKFGKLGSVYPWYQVVRRMPGGQENVALDFIATAPLASGIAYLKNIALA